VVFAIRWFHKGLGYTRAEMKISDGQCHRKQTARLFFELLDAKRKSWRAEQVQAKPVARRFKEGLGDGEKVR
jgi:hypothetical protein